jgi:hypothetical protein
VARSAAAPLLAVFLPAVARRKGPRWPLPLSRPHLHQRPSTFHPSS